MMDMLIFLLVTCVRMARMIVLCVVVFTMRMSAVGVAVMRMSKSQQTDKVYNQAEGADCK